MDVADSLIVLDREDAELALGALHASRERSRQRGGPHYIYDDLIERLEHATQ